MFDTLGKRPGVLYDPFLLDGVATPSLGAPGTVRRDMPLDPDQIKDGKLAGALAPQIASGRPRQ